MSSLRPEAGGLTLDGLPLERLAAEFGTPLYLYSGQSIEDRYRDLDEAWRALPHQILYSVKACPSLGVLALLGRLGAGADVVSGGELVRALRAGIPAERIVFAGVGKTDAELAQAVQAGISHINVESAGELGRLNRIAAALNRTVGVAFRITPQVVGGTHAYTETGTAVTKFGLPAEEALDLARSLPRDGPVRATGLHIHFGSQILSIGPFVEAARIARAEVLRFRAAGVPIDTLNLGGGIGIAYRGELPLAPAELAAAVTPHVADLGVTLSFEPGRYLVGPAGVLVARVIEVKRTVRKSFAIVDAAMNDLIRPALYGAHHTVLPVQERPGERELMDVVGPVCESGDFLARDRALAPLEPGDLIVVRDAGAYGFSMASNYNSRPRPAEVLIENGQARVIRRRETIDDLLSGETT